MSPQQAVEVLPASRFTHDPAPSEGRIARIFSKYRYGATSLVVFLVIWWLGAKLVDKPLFIVGPVEVWHSMAALAGSGELWLHIHTSLVEFAVGFALASAVGVLVGAVMGLYLPVKRYLDPVVAAFYATPLIAVAPIFILWFGLGIFSKVAIVFLMAVFPIIINTEVGLRTADDALTEAVRAFGGSRLNVFTKVRLPSSVPLLIAGHRLAVARALIGVVVAEMTGARAGLGYLIFVSGQTFQTGALLGSVLLLAFSGVVAMRLLLVLERRLAPWREDPK